MAAWAGDDWFYRYPVRTQGGGQDWITGPTIKLANNVARVFGNNVTEVREIDTGDAYVFYARFTDIETGFSMESAYRQRKGQATLKTKDPQRALDQVYQIGQSKAIRNVIVNSLGIYCDFAFEEAQNSLVDKIGKNLEGSRKRILERIGSLSVELPRVERSIGRVAKNWLATDIARIVAMVQGVEDGMATADETFPKIESSVSAPSEQARAGTETGGAQSVESPTADSEPAAQQASHSTVAETSSAAAEELDLGGGRQGTHTVTIGDSLDTELAAYEAGKAAKAAGHRRSALPGELRIAEREKEAQAWLRGHDGKAFH